MTCTGVGFSSVVTVTSPKRRSPARVHVASASVRAPERHLERPRKARLVRSRLALERREVVAELLASDRVDPPGRERHEVIRLDLRRHVRPRGLPVAVGSDVMGLDDVGPELEQADRGDRSERPSLPWRWPRALVLIAVHGAASLHAAPSAVTPERMEQKDQKIRKYRMDQRKV